MGSKEEKEEKGKRYVRERITGKRKEGIRRRVGGWRKDNFERKDTCILGGYDITYKGVPHHS